MGDTEAFYYEPNEDEPLSTELVRAIAKAHDEDVIEQTGVNSEDSNTDALDGLFQQHNAKITLQFEADTATVTITADENRTPAISIESHR